MLDTSAAVEAAAAVLRSATLDGQPVFPESVAHDVARALVNVVVEELHVDEVVERLRAQNKLSSDRWQLRTAQLQSECDRERALSAEVARVVGTATELTTDGYLRITDNLSQYGQRALADLVAERDRLAAELRLYHDALAEVARWRARLPSWHELANVREFAQEVLSQAQALAE